MNLSFLVGIKLHQEGVRISMNMPLGHVAHRAFFLLVIYLAKQHKMHNFCLPLGCFLEKLIIHLYIFWSLLGTVPSR